MSTVMHAARNLQANEPGAAQARPERFSFTATGSEYFRIWLVNLLLNVLTLGIYSAWAKVRKLQYFYGSTTVAGASFEYHGNPVTILKGRLIVWACLAAYFLGAQQSRNIRLMLFAALAALVPWLIWKSLQFRLLNTSYRGIRFGFRGSVAQAYLNFLLLPALAPFSVFLLLAELNALELHPQFSGLALAGLCLLAPFVHQRIKKFQHEESRFGATHFSFRAGAGAFYKAYLIAALVILAGIVVIFLVSALILYRNQEDESQLTGVAAFAFGHLIIAAISLWTLAFLRLFVTMLQNLIWNNTRLGKHRFASDMKWGRMMFIAITNLIGILVTVGLFTPFAQVRSLKYRIESMTLLAHDDLDRFIATAQAEVAATGEGMSDLVDFDLSL